tara:strand:- start:93 stop:605 length:513 start_codon:yes stop_codon:yes gene_type:complete
MTGLFDRFLNAYAADKTIEAINRQTDVIENQTRQQDDYDPEDQELWELYKKARSNFYYELESLDKDIDSLKSEDQLEEDDKEFLLERLTSVENFISKEFSNLESITLKTNEYYENDLKSDIDDYISTIKYIIDSLKDMCDDELVTENEIEHSLVEIKDLRKKLRSLKLKL